MKRWNVVALRALWAVSLCCHAAARLSAGVVLAAQHDASAKPGQSDSTNFSAVMSRFDKERHRSLRELRDLGTSEARTVLLETALGQRGSEYEEWAASCYLKTLSHTSDARRLFSARNSEVWGVGIRALTKEGVPLDADLLQLITGMLQSTNLHIRQNCAYYLEAGAGADFGREKAVAMIRSLETVEGCPGFTRPIAYATDYIHPWTEGGSACRDLIAALSQTGGLELTTLRELTPPSPGLARDCVLIARAWRRDSTVKRELYRIMRESSVGKVRFAAVNAFHFPNNGSLSDVPALEQVAASDPLSVTPDAGAKLHYENWNPGKKAPDQLYPIREHALRAIELIRRQSQQ